MTKHAKKNKKNKIISIIVITILICSISYITISKYINYRKQKEQQEILNKIKINEEEITEETTERMLKLKELQKENFDIVGWLEIEKTGINYPVLKTNNNDYYLTHTYKKENSKNGSIFLDKDYNFSIPSSNLLIYGHNNKNGKMFEELLNYENEEYYKKHPNIRFTTEKWDSTFEIIAVFKSRVYYKDETNVFRYYYFINAENEEEYNYYIEQCKKASLYNIDTSAKYGNQLLTLSTCDYSTANGRFVVVAREIK